MFPLTDITAVLTALLIIIGVQTISFGLISDMIKNRTHEKKILQRIIH